MTSSRALHHLDRLHRRFDGPLPKDFRACALAGGPLARGEAVKAARLAFLEEQARWTRAVLASRRPGGDLPHLAALSGELADLRRTAVDILNAGERPNRAR